MSQEVDIRDTTVVYDSPVWRITKKNLAVASGVTSDGRNVQGIGESRWSEDGALDAAVENLKQNVRETDFSFRITVLEGGYANVRIEFLEEQGIYRTTGSTRGLTKNKTVEINASTDGRTVNAKGEEKTIGAENIGFGSRDWTDMLSSALDSARSRLDRVGTTSVEN